jgi:hypothetical protein
MQWPESHWWIFVKFDVGGFFENHRENSSLIKSLDMSNGYFT